MSDGDVALFFAVLLIAAAGINAIFPEEPDRKRWDNSRAATQRDLSEVLAGRGKTQEERPHLAPLIALLIVLAVIAVVALNP